MHLLVAVDQWVYYFPYAEMADLCEFMAEYSIFFKQDMPKNQVHLLQGIYADQSVVD